VNLSRDLDNQDDQSLIFHILSTLIPVILIHGFLSMFFPSLTNQAKLGPSKNIIVDDSAIAVTADSLASHTAAVTPSDDATVVATGHSSDGSPAGRLVIDDGSLSDGSGCRAELDR
jgi:hypothetical protein